MGPAIRRFPGLVFLMISAVYACGSGDEGKDGPCPTCSIEFKTVGLLGHPEDDTSVREDATDAVCTVSRLSTGDFLVSTGVGGGEILMYGKSGRIERRIGRPGQGPGEFGTHLTIWLAPGDTLHVFDQGNARVQTFDAAGEFVPSFQLPWPIARFALLGSNEWLVHPMPVSPSFATRPVFAILSQTGEVLVEHGTIPADLLDEESWVVAAENRGGFWEANVGEYAVRLRNRAGEVERLIEFSADWYPSWDRVDPGAPMSVPFPPFLWHLYEDGESRLWTYVIVPDANWAPRTSYPRGSNGINRMFDTMVEVTDLPSGEVLASTRVDEFLSSSCGSDLVYAVVDSDTGDTLMEVLRPTLVGIERTGAYGGR